MLWCFLYFIDSIGVGLGRYKGCCFWFLAWREGSEWFRRETISIDACLLSCSLTTYMALIFSIAYARDDCDSSSPHER